MSVLIVGGDHLGSIPKELKKIVVDDIRLFYNNDIRFLGQF